MEAKLKYSLADPAGKVISMGEAVAKLGVEDLSLAPMAGGPLSFSLRDIASIEEMDYHIMVQLRPSGSLMLFNAGSLYEDLARALFRAVNELEMKDLLMNERLLKQGVPVETEMLSPEAASIGRGEARLYETALLIMPERSGLIRLRFADLRSAEKSDYRLILEMESGAKVALSKLGRELDPLHKGVKDGMASLNSATEAMVRDAYPEADPAGVARAAGLLKDGRSASRPELESACPGLWGALERRLVTFEMQKEFEFLGSLSGADGVRIGMKRPLHADKSKDYIFVLAPVFSADRGRGGNAIAFEASAEEGEGRATYLFRIWGRQEYQQLPQETMAMQAEEACRRIARGLGAVNFRREPIYLREIDLQTPERSSYRYAILRIPELRFLRERFIGRVAHTDLEQWKRDIGSILDFNVAQTDDSSVWSKGKESP